jgi:hypothetical protein
MIRYSCGILFMLFSFCYLYFLQGEILAVGGDGKLDGAAWTLPVNGMGYAVIKNKN